MLSACLSALKPGLADQFNYSHQMTDKMKMRTDFQAPTPKRNIKLAIDTSSPAKWVLHGWDWQIQFSM